MPDVEEPQEHVVPSDAMRDAVGKVAELRAYAQQYVAAKVDHWKLTARTIAIFAILGVVALVVVGASLVIALVMLFEGLAGLISAGTGGRMWVGNLVVGAVLLGLFGGAAFIGLRVVKKSWFKATVKKYELAERKQRETYGQSSRDRTASAGRVEV